MRDPHVVAKQIKEAIPSTETEAIELMEKVCRDICYLAPEQEPSKWRKIAAAVGQLVPYPAVEEWHFQVAALITGRTIEEIREEAECLRKHSSS